MTRDETEIVARVQAAVNEAWAPALSAWSDFLLLQPPRLELKGPIAAIDLTTRQVQLNARMIEERSLEPCLEGLLAHEIGHHLKYPATLETQARLLVLGKSLWPKQFRPELTNLFTDFLINRELEESYQSAFSAVYLSDPKGAPGADPIFELYLTMYEIAWKLAPGSLCRHEAEVESVEQRRKVVSLVNSLASDSSIFLKFIRFCELFVPLLPESEETKIVSLCGGPGDPEEDDWAAALEASPAEIDAIREAAKQGRLRGDQTRRALEPLRPGGLPPRVNSKPIMMAAYRRMALRHLLRPPESVRKRADPAIPEAHEPWEVGDAVKEIDWQGSALRGGIALGQFEKRELGQDDGEDQRGLTASRLEIYLDVSGSMPVGVLSFNALTLSAMILALSAIRARSSARLIVFSDQAKIQEWTRSEDIAVRFLLETSGGGTQFPFDQLRLSMKRHRSERPFRIVISDYDFISNSSEPGGHGLLERAVRDSGFAAILHAPLAEAASLIQATGIQVLAVDDAMDMPGVASLLARKLFK